MSLECSHVVLRVSDLAAAREFYIDKLELPVLDDHQQMFSIRAGQLRVSVFPGGKQLAADGSEDANAAMILRTSNLDDAVARLKEKGVPFEGEIVEAPGFMRHIAFTDPDNNLLYLGEYLRDPLAPTAS